MTSPKDGYLQFFVPPHLNGLLPRGKGSTRAADYEEGERGPAVVVGVMGNESEMDESDVVTDSEENEYIGGNFFGSGLGLQLFGLLREDMRRRNRVPSPPERGSGSQRRRLDPLRDHSASKYSITSAVYSSNGDGELIEFIIRRTFISYSFFCLCHFSHPCLIQR